MKKSDLDEKIYRLELVLGECKQDPDPVIKNLIIRIRIRPKMDRIRKPDLIHASKVIFLWEGDFKNKSFLKKWVEI